MAKLMKTFIGQLGGMATRLAGGDDGAERADSGTGADVDDASSCNSVKAPTELSSKLSLSSGEEDRDSHGGAAGECPAKRGYLSKWTNYLHGWQERYVVVAEGILSYYKSESDTQFGCRGSISLHQVRLLLHEFDELRFDIRVHDCTYFFRTTSREELMYWTDTVEGNKRHLAETGFSMGHIRRQPSILSLSAISQASTSSSKLGYDFHTKLAEIETYRDILCRQVDTLQGYFDSLAAENNGAGTYAYKLYSSVVTAENKAPDPPTELSYILTWTWVAPLC
jgi:collagen type IV alpha-3-binding protein